MRLKITSILLVLISFYSVAQNRKGALRLQPGSNSHKLYVAFADGTIIKDAAGKVNEIAIPEFAALIAEYSMVLLPGLTLTPEKLNQMELDAIRISGSGKSVNRLRNILEVQIDNPTNKRLLELAEKLEYLKEVEYCSLISARSIQPPGDIAPVTPSYQAQQGYIGNNGVKMDYAWNMGLNGQGINIRDVEYGMNKDHEELNEMPAFIAPGMDVSPDASEDYTEHGTAVFGVMIADKGAYGISGMAYGANEMLLFPEWQSFGYNRVFAVSQSIAASVAGDVIVYEMQATGAQGEYGPAEYNNVIWDLTKAASDAGVIVVAAAGNGAEDLDSFEYIPYMNRGNSGAIIVGAGSSNIGRNRLNYSTYGTRVDVQGWGQGVYTSGYGDAVTIAGDFNQRYTWFSGTSSATPIVASCAVVLQSYYHTLTGNYMTGPQMRTLLQDTGSPQGFNNFGNIGPLPNMENAVNYLTEQFLSVKTSDKPDFVVYPNPVQDKLTLITQQLANTASVEIYNAIGQSVYQAALPANKEIDFSIFSAGVYFVKISDNGKSVTKKVVRK
ncbi:MAG: T9SS type A sorting domain-containing protein [Flavobacterium sp.]|nr:MAG: T9SS type A sorting domain-containing protein [Flavobacterium sp.]